MIDIIFHDKTGVTPYNPGQTGGFENAAGSGEIHYYRLFDGVGIMLLRLERMGLEPDIDHYEVVYTAPLLPYKDQNTMLEELYAKFNVSRPDDFTGHSLSVSDIVALRQNGVVSCHYVDSIGFQELPGFLKPENYLKAAEMAMEDDYGMIDGVINNGKKEEPVEKASVLDQLKEKQEAVPPAPPRRCCEEKEL